MTANKYSVEEQADGTHAVFNNGGFVRGGWKNHDRVGALSFARDLADNDEAAGVPVIRTDDEGNPVATVAEPEKRFVGTIDLTPSWRSLIPMFIAAMQDGTPTGRAMARDELYRLADFADAHLAALKEEKTNAD